MDKHFCTCPVTGCPRHPSNHAEGCDPCIQDNLKHGKMPACFFLAVSNDVSGVKKYTVESFVEFYLEQKNKNKEEA